jgi:hypothetical protein
MQITPKLRKLMLAIHVTASVGWVGSLAVFLAHAVASVASSDTQIVKAACIAMGVSAWFVIFPLSLLSLATGIIQAVGTAWGLVRHYWVLFKLLLTAVATTVLLLKLAPIRYVADAATQLGSIDPGTFDMRLSLLVHAVGGLVFLLAATALAIYKPAGVTRFAGEMRSVEVPRWVKWSAIAVLIVGAFLAIVVTLGAHGPGMHTLGE